MNETIYYWDGVALVSDQRLLFGSKSYSPDGLQAVNVIQLNSGDARPTAKRRSNPIILLVVATLIGGIVAYLLNPGWIVQLLIFVGTLELLRRTGKHFARTESLTVLPKPLIYLLELRTERGKFRVLASLDKGYLQAIADTISQTLLHAAYTLKGEEIEPQSIHGIAQGEPAGRYYRQDSLYYDGIVAVSYDRVRLASKEFSTSEIHAVGIDEAFSDSMDWFLIAWLAMGAIALGSFLASPLLSEPYHSLTHDLSVATGSLAFVVLYASIFVSTSPGQRAYLLNVKTNGKVESTFASLDKEYIQKIVKSIQQAKADAAPSLASAR